VITAVKSGFNDLQLATVVCKHRSAGPCRLSVAVACISSHPGEPPAIRRGGELNVRVVDRLKETKQHFHRGVGAAVDDNAVRPISCSSCGGDVVAESDRRCADLAEGVLAGRAGKHPIST